MRIRSHPGLQLTPSGDGNVLVEHPHTGRSVVVGSAVGELLGILNDPEELADVVRGVGEGVPQHVIDELIAADLVVVGEDGAPFARWLRPVVPTFMDAPLGGPGSAQITVVGAPFDSLSVSGTGARDGPAALRLASSVAAYRLDPQTERPRGIVDHYRGGRALAGVTFADGGDLDVAPGERLTEIGWRLTEIVREARRVGSVPLVLGGDHSIAAWSIAGLAGETISVLHLDAHSDIAEHPANGVPTNASVARALAQQPHVGALVSVGLRGFLPEEQQPLSAAHTLVTAAAARRMGTAALVGLLPAELPCYVTLDVDVLDPSCAPGTNCLVPGGFSFELVRELLDALGRARPLAGCDVVEVNPSRDPYLQTAQAGAYLAIALLAAAASSWT